MVLATFKRGLDIVLHPGKETEVKMTLKEVLATYYKFAVVPFAMTTLTAILVVSVNPSLIASVPQGALIANSIDTTLFFSQLLMFALILPVLLLVMAGLLHLIGRLFRLFDGEFARTLTAVLYSAFSSMLFMFASSFGLIGGFVYLISLAYGAYVLVVGLSKQHKTTITNAFVVGLALFVLIVIVTSVFISSFAALAGGKA